MGRNLGRYFCVGVAAIVVLAVAQPAAAKDPKVGKSKKVGDYKVTVHLVEEPTSGAPVFGPAPGMEIIAVDAEVCARSDEVDSVNALQFTLQTNTNRSYDPFSPAGHDPAMSVQPLAGKGSCARGWLGYEIPVDERARFVIFEDAPILSDNTQRWRVPKPVV